MCTLPPTIDICTGNGIGECQLLGQNLFNYWDDNNCVLEFEKTLNINPILYSYDGIFYVSESTGASGNAQFNIYQYNINGLQNAQYYVNQLYQNYINASYNITNDITSSSYNTFQDTILNLCLNPKLPGICDSFLNNFCSNVTRDDITGVTAGNNTNNNIGNNTLLNFCGCYVAPDPIYAQYTLGSYDCIIGSSGCTAGCYPLNNTTCYSQPACDPLCHNAQTIQKAYPPSGNFITCPQEICVIDNVTINILNSNVVGGINFNSVCAGCGGTGGADGCLCIISGINITETTTSIGMTDISNYCAGSSVCITELNGNTTIGNCIDYKTPPPPVINYTPLQIIKHNIYLIIILGIILIIIILILISTKYDKTTIYNPTIIEGIK